MFKKIHWERIPVVNIFFVFLHADFGKMRLHKEGLLPITFTVAFVAACLVPYFMFANLPLWVDILVVAFFVILLFTIVRFFRVPLRHINHVENGVLSPADGTVISIEETTEHEYFKDSRIKISVFMSVYNVHVNFYPVDGEIEYVAYHPGKYFVAHLPKSSLDNEHNTVVVRKNEHDVVLFRQIAGFVARRIVSYPEPGDTVKQGQEMGMIRFGSRVDVFLPLDAEVNVKVGEKVRTQKTVLAYF